MNAKGMLANDRDKCFQDKGTDSSFINTAIINQMLGLPEGEFWKLVSIRLNVPQSKANQKELEDEHREYWSWNYLIEEIFLHIASLKVLVAHNDRQITIYKYYSQALRLKKWIPIAKPPVEFVINASDLTARILAELKALGQEESQQVLKLAVCTNFRKYCWSKVYSW